MNKKTYDAMDQYHSQWIRWDLPFEEALDELKIIFLKNFKEKDVEEYFKEIRKETKKTQDCFDDNGFFLLNLVLEYPELLKFIKKEFQDVPSVLNRMREDDARSKFLKR